MSDPDIDARLKAASRAERDRAIVDAHQAGYTIRAIVALVGYSIGRVHQIINQEQAE